MKSSQPIRWSAWLAALLWAMRLPALSVSTTEIGFARILHGWTNYSTAFNATHDPDPDVGDYVTLASFYTPDKYVRPSHYGVILIWRGEPGQHLDFAAFDFQIQIWSNLDEFTNSPTSGNVTNITFAAPTGGSTTVRDATTRGGRAAYYITFSLTNVALTLAPGCTYLIGFSASTDTSENGEFYVPTAASAGQSDAQAGDLVPGDWQYLKDIGGSTIYSGQLATELFVTALPQLRLLALTNGTEISWPASLTGAAVESTPWVGPLAVWSTVTATPVADGGWSKLTLPNNGAVQKFYRLNPNVR
jgi:hypothetical protein